MDSSEPIPVSFAQMEKDLISALESDAHNQLENEAKLRAISQRVSYDEFRDIVRGVHLKPVSSGSLSVNKPQKGRIWNNIALSKKSYETEACEARKGTAAIPANHYSLNQLPISAQFLNSWQQSDTKSRLLILYKIGPAGLNNIFTIDMPTALLGEIFEALLCFNPVTDVVAVIKLMEALTKIKRFNLIVHFLNASERATCQQLIHKLLASLVQREQDFAEEGITEWTIQELGKRFLVKL